jgi:hypothetical protein
MLVCFMKHNLRHQPCARILILLIILLVIAKAYGRREKLAEHNYAGILTCTFIE